MMLGKRKQVQAAGVGPEVKPDSLEELFVQFAHESVERFPHLKGRLLIFDVHRGKYYTQALDPQKTKFSSKYLDEDVSKYLEIHSCTKEILRDLLTSCAHYDSSRDVRVIFINKLSDQVEMNHISSEIKKQFLITLDHELAHCAIKEGEDALGNALHASLVRENIADAYSLIRYYQRFGVEEDRQQDILDPWYRGWGMLNNQGTHSTMFVLEELINCKDKIDFASLTPEQTADLAKRFARAYMAPVPVVKNLKKIFDGVARTDYKLSEKVAKVLAERTFDPANDYYAAKFGNRMLQDFLEGRLIGEGERIVLTGSYWDDVRRKSKELEFKLAQEGILFKMPQVKQKLSSATQNKPA